MRTTLLVCAVLAVVVRYGEGFPVEEWDAWKLLYNKHYTSVAEEAEHREIWMQHYTVFTEHMADEGRSFDMEMNEFSDQILPRTNLNLDQLLGEDDVDYYEHDDALIYAPASWDWRTKGAISPVHNQGQSGDALSFAATESVESFHFINTGMLTSLSTGEMHDCCTSPPLYSKTVFDCVHKIGGLCSRSSYPAAANICKNNSCTAVATVKGGMQSPAGDEDQLVETVYEYKTPIMVVVDASHASFQIYQSGVYSDPTTTTIVKSGMQSPAGDEDQLVEAVYKTPVMVAVDASHASFQIYQSGVYSDPDCKTDMPDHAMQLVGYGSMDGNDYWICKNSWGASWGMQGYILIARNKDNMCGIASNAVYPV